MDPVQLSIFANRLAGICDEMGALLRASALCPDSASMLTTLDLANMGLTTVFTAGERGE